MDMDVKKEEEKDCDDDEEEEKEYTFNIQPLALHGFSTSKQTSTREWVNYKNDRRENESNRKPKKNQVDEWVSQQLQEWKRERARMRWHMEWKCACLRALRLENES